MQRKRWLVILAGLGLLLLVLVMLRPQSSPEGGADGEARRGGSTSAIAVEVAPVSRRTITDVAYYTGTLEPGAQFMLAPKAGGRLRSLEVDIGDLVAPGQVVARLDDEEFRQAVAEQRAALEVAEAQLEDARAQQQVKRRAWERVADLRERQLSSEAEADVARSEFDAARANVRVAEARVAQQQAALRTAEIRLDYTTVRAEWSGEDVERVRYVGERFVDEGANVAANDPIVSVIDINTLRGVIHVTDRDLARMRVGQSARITTQAWPGETFSGRVHRIAPLLQEDSRQARVELRVPNPGRRLSPGFFVNVEIDLQVIDSARVVPLDAVTRQNGERGVYQVVAGEDDQPEVRWQAVTEGVRTRQYVQILEPDLEGRVVTLGQHRLSDGAAVHVAD